MFDSFDRAARTAGAPHYCVNVWCASAANLSSSFSLEAEEARETPAPRISPGTTSSLR